MPWGTKNNDRKPLGDMILTVDTREQTPTWKALRKLKIPYVKKALPAGDFESEQCIAERKTMPDLIQSIKPKKKGSKSRFFDQMLKLSDYGEDHDKVPYLFVSGSFAETRRLLGKRGYKFNENAVMGALASSSVRYGVQVYAMFEDTNHLIKSLYYVFTKMDEGKYMLPHRTKLKRAKNRKIALWCTILRTTPSIASQIIKKYDGLDDLMEVLRDNPYELEYIYGVGPKTVKKWCEQLL